MVFKEGSYRAIKEDGDNAEAYYLRGQAYLTLKDIQKAIVDYRVAAQFQFKDSEQILAKISAID
jgi:Tfp pilus assembly protein PilF